MASLGQPGPAGARSVENTRASRARRTMSLSSAARKPFNLITAIVELTGPITHNGVHETPQKSRLLFPGMSGAYLGAS